MLGSQSRQVSSLPYTPLISSPPPALRSSSPPMSPRIFMRSEVRRLRRSATGTNIFFVCISLLLIYAVFAGPSTPAASQAGLNDPGITAARAAAAKTGRAGSAFVSDSTHVRQSQIAYHGILYDYPLPDPESRTSDMMDTFARYANRGLCDISSLDLHRPFEPLCQTKDDMLSAMSEGGRIGLNAPYMPRGCDMRWFDRGDICSILSKFDRIFFIGDSMMRHAVGAMHIFLREDLGYGAVTQWNFRPDERESCFCEGQFDTLKCAVQGIFNSEDVVKFDPDSMHCDARSLDIQNHVITTYPPSSGELQSLGDAISVRSSNKPVAFVYSQGHYNDLNPEATSGWITAIQRIISERLDMNVPRAQLFVTPGSSGPEMLDRELLKHGDKALQLFEEGMQARSKQLRVDILGTWNSTVQTTSIDGKHSGIRGNLLKSMMILNWLDLVDPVTGIGNIVKPTRPATASHDRLSYEVGIDRSRAGLQKSTETVDKKVASIEAIAASAEAADMETSDAESDVAVKPVSSEKSDEAPEVAAVAAEASKEPTVQAAVSAAEPAKELPKVEPLVGAKNVQFQDKTGQPPKAAAAAAAPAKAPAPVAPAPQRAPVRAATEKPVVAAPAAPEAGTAL
ncbi:uncharacterized protein V1518DRAFT_423871 [Limtongia smithiae]|uniref:uncharacterized protein n=1 Tax=Limtongia smithiae TaxID=1125753 RepID=UPI0034CFDFE2